MMIVMDFFRVDRSIFSNLVNELWDQRAWDSCG